ncbi:MAG: pyridoxamine kinase [Oscillospiraceae bacterium]|nr:pyridoxamine kinase [Oscillospiraceae bacterium]
MKRVIAIHDMSGVGRCSLTVIMPIISAMGIQVCPVPTAVLSTHTGGFGDMVFKDMTDFIKPCYKHYKDLGLNFDAVYSGFLASATQIDSCLDFFMGFSDALKVVDPVMGDNGKPYKTYTKELCERMSELCKIADIITPNLTEAAIILGEEYTPVLDRKTATNWLLRLSEIAKCVVITGVRLVENPYDDAVFNIGLERGQNSPLFVEYKQLPVHYPGTGDVFASVLTGALLKELQGRNLKKAISQATEFAGAAVEITYKAKTEPRNGVMFERVLNRLCQDESCRGGFSTDTEVRRETKQAT